MNMSEGTFSLIASQIITRAITSCLSNGQCGNSRLGKESERNELIHAKRSELSCLKHRELMTNSLTVVAEVFQIH